MPPKRLTADQRLKNTLKQAQDYLAIKGKRRSNPITTAKFLGFAPTRRGVPLTPSLTGDYKKLVEAEVIKRWAKDNTKISQTITIKYKYHFKRTPNQKVIDTIKETITGTRSTIDALREERRNEIISNLEEAYPEIIDEVISEDISKPTRMRVGAGGKFIAKGIRAVRMKRMGALKLDCDYVGDTSWDRNEDTCVFDYLYAEYADVKGFKKFLPKEDRELCYDRLNNLFKEDDEDDPLTEGVNIDQLYKFAEKFKIPMMAFDKHEKKIVYYRPDDANDKVKPLMFIVANTHYYPIQDKSKRASMSAKVRESNKNELERFKSIRNWSSDDIETATIEPKDTENILSPIFSVDDEPIGNDYLMYVINQQKVIPSNIEVEGSKVIRFKIGNQKYITNKQSDLEKQIETYVVAQGDKYWGQSPNYILMDLFEKHYGKGFGKMGLCSRVNPSVYEVLLDDKVKYRQHYGATRDNTDILMLADEKFVEKVDLIETEVEVKEIFTNKKRTKKQQTKITKQVPLPRKRVIDEMIENGTAVCYDLNKLYTTCLFDPFDDFIVYNEEDTIYTFNQDMKKPLPTGLYYVETDDLTLLHQSNWYSNKIIDKAIQEKIKLKIKWELIPKPRYSNQGLIDKKFFTEFIRKMYAETPFGKDLINRFVGYLGKTTTQSRVVEMDTDVEEIWRCFVNCEAPTNEDNDDHYFFKPEYIDSNFNRLRQRNLIIENINNDEEPIYLYGYEKTTGRAEMCLPMWIQLLDWSNMRLFNMIKKVGGELAFRHTDCILSLGGKVGLDAEGFGGFKKEDHTKLNLRSPMKTERHYTSWNWKANWNKNETLKSSNQWKEIIDYAIENRGLLIEGRAGTGKSYIPNMAMNEGILKLEFNCKTMSFTNKASRNIKGSTIHKTLHITQRNTIPKATFDGLRKYKYFVIDEIGMISSDLWKLLKLVKQRYPSSIWILLGDYRQLPPIESGLTRIGADLDIFNLPIVKYLTNFNKIELTERQRYDLPLWDYLERGFNRNNWNDLPTRAITPDEIYNGKAICYYNKTRDSVNDRCMTYFKNQTTSMFIEYQRTDDDDRPKCIYIYEGLPVMSYKNCVDLAIVNSEEFIVIGYDNKNIILKRDTDLPNVEVAVDKFHTYFVCNYCSTTHKSQGATYKGNVFIFDWERIKKDKNVAYTACSRGTALSKLIIADNVAV